MKEYRLSLLLIMLLPAMVNAQYWFQSGARTGADTFFNNGAKVTIETLANQNISDGSIAFWIGETLSNKAFIQVGYLIPNKSANYPTNCTINGCSSSVYLAKGSPSWFYEYFNSSQNSTFTGQIGQNDSAGLNGSFHTYGFYSKNNSWYIFIDNKTLGNIYLGSNNSGDNEPVALEELANTTDSSAKIAPVIFSNLSIFKNGRFVPAPEGYSYSGYGIGSKTNVPDPYGVSEINNRVNYFIVGSGLQASDNQQLWQLGYYLKIFSNYGNLSQYAEYSPYKRIKLSEPALIPVDNGIREVFKSWSGYGAGSYTGTFETTNITMFQNITETANWETQYFLNVSSQFGNSSGSGWYNANYTANFSINASTVYAGNMSRWEFVGWSDGAKNRSSNTLVNEPQSIHALWGKQYYLNASSSYSPVNGSGWYLQNSIAKLSILKTYSNISNDTRHAFFSWSNGNSSADLKLKIDTQVSIEAIYRNQSLSYLKAIDVYGRPVPINIFYSSNGPITNRTFLFDNYSYRIIHAYYKGINLSLNQSISTDSPGTITINLPLYDINISTSDIFGIPVNASVNVQFPNGTRESLQSGTSGELRITEVPYGRLSVSSIFSGQDVNVQSKVGEATHITFLSYLDLIIFAIIAIILLAMYRFSRRTLYRMRPF